MAALAGLTYARCHIADKIGAYQRGRIARLGTHSSLRSMLGFGRQNIVKNTRLDSLTFSYLFDLDRHIGLGRDFFPDLPGLAGNFTRHRLPDRLEPSGGTRAIGSTLWRW